MTLTSPAHPPLFVGVGPVLVDQYVHCDQLPEGPDLPDPGTKLQAIDAEHMRMARKHWVDGWAVETQVGGPVYVALRQARELGARVDFVGAIGSDELGDLIVDQLGQQAFNVDRLVRQHGQRSGSAIVWIDRCGERSILFDSGSLEPLGHSAALPLLAGDADVVHIDSREPAAAQGLAAAARDRHIPVHYDVDPWNQWTEKLMALSNTVQVSLRELRERVPGENAAVEAERLQREYNLDLAVVTMGEAGVCAMDNHGEAFTFGAYPTNAVDSTGAGDAFAGAFEYARRCGADTGTALRIACAAGAFISGRAGNAALASEHDIERIVKGDVKTHE